MSIRAGSSTVALAALALWLALWPAADAITGASNTVLDLSSPGAAPTAHCADAPDELSDCASAPSCSRMLAANQGAKACGDTRSRCATDPIPDSEGDLACAGTNAARCGQCQCIGGLVLFAASPPQFSPDLELVGTLSAARFDEASRCPRPLLRPPMANLSNTA